MSMIEIGLKNLKGSWKMLRRKTSNSLWMQLRISNMTPRIMSSEQKIALSASINSKRVKQ
jgi:hypothetical protein